MNSYRKMRYYLRLLKNGFLIADRINLLDSFKEFAESNKLLVQEMISRVDPEDSDIFWNFFDSICEDINNWTELIFSEFTRLLTAAEKSENPTPIIDSLEAFCLFIQKQDNEFMTNIRNTIKMFLSTNNCHLKRFLVWLLAECIYDSNNSDINLIKRLKYDKDTIIRYYAYMSYNKFKGFPPEKGISSYDKLIISISDIYAC